MSQNITTAHFVVWSWRSGLVANVGRFQHLQQREFCDISIVPSCCHVLLIKDESKENKVTLFEDFVISSPIRSLSEITEKKVKLPKTRSADAHT